MINLLTKNQEVKFQYYVDKWLSIGLSTNKVNKKLGEKAAIKCYEIANLKAPKKIVWTRSPIDCANYIKNKNMKNEVRSQVWSQVRSQVESQVRSQVESQVGSQVRSQVWSQVRSQVWSQVRSQVGSQVGSQVRSQVGSQVRSQAYGAYDADFLAFFDFFMNECKIKDCEKLIPLSELAKNCGWWAPFKDICILQEKPIEIHMKKGLLHNLFGPSILYSDGFSVYSLEGERLDYKDWDKETIKYRTKAGKILFGDNK